MQSEFNLDSELMNSLTKSKAINELLGISKDEDPLDEILDPVPSIALRANENNSLTPPADSNQAVLRIKKSKFSFVQDGKVDKKRSLAFNDLKSENSSANADVEDSETNLKFENKLNHGVQYTKNRPLDSNVFKMFKNSRTPPLTQNFLKTIDSLDSREEISRSDQRRRQTEYKLQGRYDRSPNDAGGSKKHNLPPTGKPKIKDHDASQPVETERGDLLHEENIDPGSTDENNNIDKSPIILNE
jgi:hypothetical protein